MNDCFESVRLIQRYYNRPGIFKMDYSITYKLAFSPDLSCHSSFMSKASVRRQDLAPDLISHGSLVADPVADILN